ncbi:MAG: AAA family ATPase [Acidobacteriota bacterium]
MSERHELATPEELAPALRSVELVLSELDRALLGRTTLHRQVLAAVMSRGHVLLEGLPGLGKTMLIKRLGEVLGLGFSRVQFTPDLMPGDILGAHILQESSGGSRELSFRPGPVFTNLLLADEINRASPKTQSALLEAMQESAITLLGQTRPLPDPFFVLASQNPIDLEGTYPLPEAQLDRFLFKLKVDAAGMQVLQDIVMTRRRGALPPVGATLGADALATLFATMDRIVLPRAVASYVARIVAATHPGSREATPNVTAYVTYGASPRAAIALSESARAIALIAGRPTVGFEDVRAVANAVLNHRVILGYRSRLEGITGERLIDELLKAIDPASLDLPADVVVS